MTNYQNVAYNERMNVIRKLTFLFVILALVFPVAVVNAADMQDCPPSMMSSDMNMDMPCHDDMSQNTDSDCADMCKDHCLVSAVSGILSAWFTNVSFTGKGQDFLMYRENYTSLTPDALYHPPIVIS